MSKGGSEAINMKSVLGESPLKVLLEVKCADLKQFFYVTNIALIN